MSAQIYLKSDGGTARVARSTIEKWVAALRSGRYPKGVGALQSNVGFCCLGVACDLFIPEAKKQRFKATPKNALSGYTPIDQKYAPKWLKIINTVGVVWDPETHKYIIPTLSDLNDNGKGFFYIADEIERRFLK